MQIYIFQNHRRSREQPPLWGWQVPPGMGNDLNINVFMKHFFFRILCKPSNQEKKESHAITSESNAERTRYAGKNNIDIVQTFLLADLWINDLIITDLKWFYHQHLVAIRTKILGLVFYIVYDLFLRNLKDLSEQKLNTMY